MKKQLFLAALLLVASGCGRAVDPAAQPYVESFLAEMHARGIHTEFNSSVQFGDPTQQPGSEPYAIGFCENWGKSITLSKAAWDKMDETGRMLLVWHELGHCVLMRGHKQDLVAPTYMCTQRDHSGACTGDDYYAWREPASMMHPSDPKSMLVANNPEYKQSLIEEMFSKQ